jgi:hypothetical protein
MSGSLNAPGSLIKIPAIIKAHNPIIAIHKDKMNLPNIKIGFLLVK